jgi:hypothetical protein
MQLYLEKLSLSSINFIFRNNYLKEYLRNIDKNIYYIDASRMGLYCGQLFGKIFRVKFRQLKFKMMDVKDERGDLVNRRIKGKDLFEIKNKIIDSVEYQQMFHPSWKQARLEGFLKKGVIDGGVIDVLSVSKTLYLVNVIFWHHKKQITNESKLLISRRAWFNIFKGYASNLDVELI